MGVLLALLSALCYGSSDFTAGIGGRRSDPSAVTVIAQPFGPIAAAVAVVALAARSPMPHALWWGALSGVGSGVGTVSLYRGLAVARMSAVAPLSAVLSAALPALAGAALESVTGRPPPSTRPGVRSRRPGHPDDHRRRDAAR